MAPVAQRVCFLLLCCLLGLSHARVVSPPITGPEVNSPGRFGMRCPHVTTMEQYRMECAVYIDERCGCVYDDMHIDQMSCMSNRTHYEEMVRAQIDLEEEKDKMRVQNGEQSSAQRFFQVLDCLPPPLIIKPEIVRNSHGDTNDSNGNEVVPEANNAES